MTAVQSSKNATGINFDKYEDIPVEVVPGHDKLGVDAIQTFQDDLNLAGPVMDNIERAGYSKPTPVQKHALPIRNASVSSSSLLSCWHLLCLCCPCFPVFLYLDYPPLCDLSQNLNLHYQCHPLMLSFYVDAPTPHSHSRGMS